MWTKQDRLWHAAGTNGPTNVYFSLMLRAQLSLAGCFVHCGHPGTWACRSSVLRYGSMTDRAGDRNMVLMH